MKSVIVLILLINLFTRCFAQDHFVTANHIKIAYQTFGSLGSPTLILINGTASPLTDYPENFCSQIADRGYFVIRFDNRDVGHSSHLDSLGQPDWKAIIPLIKTCDKAPLPYTLQDMGMDLIGLMDALKIKKAHLAGASMGGAIAQLIAIEHPSRVLTLASISASSGNPDRIPSDPKVFAIMSAPPPKTNSEDSLSAYLVKINLAL
ncbi:MAG TPA: alpha/beta hydrolase, partial [Chryseolinea sp.]|nr:alpha/beta hydrolase [Chryseolinea sp.]